MPSRPPADRVNRRASKSKPVTEPVGRASPTLGASASQIGPLQSPQSSRRPKRSLPTAAQARVTRRIVKWYLERYYETPDDLGSARMFCDSEKVGAFALRPEDLLAPDGDALFRLLVMMTLFQRRQDAQVFRILRGISVDDAAELTRPSALLALVDEHACPWLATTEALHEGCDLSKAPETGAPYCTQNPSTACHLKRHTVLLKRYGDFGKAPTSAALVLREAGAKDLNVIRNSIFAQEANPLLRAKRMVEVLSRAWRVSEKIASMFLSAVANPDLPGSSPSWSAGLDWTYFVVIDSNVELFLRSVGFPVGRDYDCKRTFIGALAESIDLRRFRGGLHRHNPRLVQQAIYMFMSASNRRASPQDCSREGWLACKRCPRELRERCPVQGSPS